VQRSKGAERDKGGKIMTLDELFPTLRDLNRTEKLQAIQFLASELAKEDEMRLKAGAEYEIWSPYDAYEAADTMMRLLNESQSGDHE
jgi:hypothetical protein